MKSVKFRASVILASFVLFTGASCHSPARSSSLIDAYRRAACVEPGYARGVDPPTRGWDANVSISDGSQVTIEGAEIVWGRIVIQYQSDGHRVTAVAPGDYIYPADVRINDGRDPLYVKAEGAAGGIWEETWLYEYDLSDRKQVRKERVRPDGLPPECPMPKGAGNTRLHPNAAVRDLR